MSKETKQLTSKAPKNLSWANARTLLLVAFIVGLALGLVGGYFTSITITNDMRENFVNEQNAITEVVVKKANQ